jgi:hypothetical protein
MKENCNRCTAGCCTSVVGLLPTPSASWIRSRDVSNAPRYLRNCAAHIQLHDRSRLSTIDWSSGHRQEGVIRRSGRWTDVQPGLHGFTWKFDHQTAGFGSLLVTSTSGLPARRYPLSFPSWPECAGEPSSQRQ